MYGNVFLHQKNVWEHRSHPTTTLVMCQVQYAETIGWDLRVYG